MFATSLRRASLAGSDVALASWQCYGNSEGSQAEVSALARVRAGARKPLLRSESVAEGGDEPDRRIDSGKDSCGRTKTNPWRVVYRKMLRGSSSGRTPEVPRILNQKIWL